MSPEARRRVETEFERLDRERADMGPLLKELTTRAPNPIELRAVASTLHSVYTGIELVLKTIVDDIDGAVPSSPSWHADLLEMATKRTADRPALLDKHMYQDLQLYVGFRHVFRSIYGHQLRWEEMRVAASRVFEVADRFKASIEAVVEGK